MSNVCVSKATLGRLPHYLKYLRSVANEKQCISATVIAKALDYGEVQVRKDLGAVSGKGRPKVGYDTGVLIGQLEELLGYGGLVKAVIVGAGKLGCALLEYDGFSQFGLEIVAAFDVRCDEIAARESAKPVYPMSEFEDFCRKNGIRLGIITVPKESAQKVCDLMLKSSISAIWSFAPEKLCVPEGFPLRHEDLALSLAHLNKQISDIPNKVEEKNE